MDSDRIRLHTKSGAEYTERLPGMVENFKRLPMRSAIINGELCLVAADGLPRFYWLLHDATRWPDETDRMYFAFDLLHQDGVDLRHLPLSERKRDLDRQCKQSRWLS